MSFKHIFTPLLNTKKCCSIQFVRKLNTSIFNPQETKASQAFAKSDYELLPCRTKEDNPLNHTKDHLGLFYTVPKETAKQIFSLQSLPKCFNKQCETFVETSIMIRQPALELFSYFKQLDSKKPAIRYMLYGPLGVGKTLTFAHCIHWAYNNGYLLIHVPWAREWIRRPKEVVTSITRPGFVDLPFDAASWLNLFKNQNSHILNNPELKTTKEYTWSKRESTPIDSPLLELIDLGINRVKYACDIIDVLVDEIKHHSMEGRLKTFVAIDGYNAFFEKKTSIKTDLKVKMSSDKVTLIDAFKKLTKNDWSNSIILLVADTKANLFAERKSDFPLYCLSKEGFEHVDPFVPVRVDPYLEKEFHSCFNYYVDRLWVQSPYAMTEEGREQLIALSTSNGMRLMNLCAPL